MAPFPSTEFYYDHLEKQVERLVRAALTLRMLVEDTGPTPPAEAETGADAPLAKIQAQLSANSVAPFDRNEINDLTHLLDAATDRVRETADSVKVFGGASSDAAARRLNGLVMEATEVIRAAVYELRSPGELTRRLRGELPRLRDEANAIFESAVGAQFNDGPDAMDLLKRISLLQGLLDIIAQYEHVGELLERVAIKE